MFKKIIAYIRNSKLADTVAQQGKAIYEKAKLQNIEKYQRQEAEFLPAALEVIESPPSYGSRPILWSFFCIAMITFLWVFFGKVDEVTIAQGKIIPDGYVRVVQTAAKGTINKIYVADGQEVKKGDLLLELDSTVLAADLAKMEKKVAYAKLEVERLTCEKENRVFMPRKLAGLEDTDIKTQTSLYNYRKLEYGAKMDEAIRDVEQGQAELKKNYTERDKQTELLQYAKDKERKLQQLLGQNAISELTLLDQQSKRNELSRNLEEQQAAIQTQEAIVAKNQAALRKLMAERNGEIDTELAAALKNLSECTEELKKARAANGVTQIVAPDDGYVSNLAVHTIGGIVMPAQTIMEIVPKDAELKAEVWVPNKDIGFVQVGQRAELKLQAFSYQKYGTVPAIILSLSPNAVDDQEQGRVYRVLLDLDKDSIDVGGRKTRLMSGMTISAEIKNRDKRIYEYFLEPFKKYTSEALRER